MAGARGCVLSIAGFDPCGGAGVLADIKTFEQLKVYGKAVITANTIQSADEFDSVNWVDEAEVLKQLDFMLSKEKFNYVKIGLVKNAAQLNTILEKLHQHNPKVKVIWDPVLSSSTGFDFHDKALDIDLKKIYLVTPNLKEMELLKELLVPSAECRVFLKGGHAEDELGVDRLFVDGKKFQFNPKRTDVKEKHGSGCVLSSAITANLEKGYSLNKACLRGKDYITKVLASNPSKLGFHKS
jgi:hydroxymethylpyrimidine/phosphomethylpyrimidine kinase